MSLNYEADKTYIQFDKYGLPFIKGDPNSIDNCVGTLVCIGFAYGFTPKICEALEQCYVNGRIIRHPDKPVVSSRDHHSYFAQYRKYTGRKVPKFSYMRGLYLWMLSISGNKLAEWMYYTLYIPGARLGNAWNRLIMRIGKAGPERTNKWWIGYEDKTDIHNRGTNLQIHFTKWQKFWLYGPRFKLFGKEYHIEILVPAYPLHNKGWQLYVMPESRRKERLKKILLLRIEISNIMLRLLYGDMVTQEEVDNYPHMTGFRPGVYFPTCDRHIRELTPEEAEFNTYEKDLIIWLYEKNTAQKN